MAAFRCAEEGGGCGVVFTRGDRRPVRPETVPWAWCPDCQKEHADDGLDA